MGELLVRGGRIVTGHGILEADVLVKDGLVAALGRGIVAGGAEVLDATGMLVLPGAVDEHVHS
ncbi:MAG: allantoinase, partial [Conexivisphaera sp.]